MEQGVIEMSDEKYFSGTGARLKELRLQLGHGPGKMAKQLDVSKTTYYKNENNFTTPAVPTLKLLAKEYDIALDWFLMGRGPRNFNKERERVEGLEKEVKTLRKEKEELEHLLVGFRTEEKQWRNEKAGMEHRHQKEIAELKTTLTTDQPELNETEIREKLEKELTEKLEADLRKTLTAELREELKEEVIREYEAASTNETPEMASREEIKELLTFMERVPLLYYEVLAHFHRFQMEHRELVNAAGAGMLPAPSMPAPYVHPQLAAAPLRTE